MKPLDYMLLAVALLGLVQLVGGLVSVGSSPLADYLFSHRNVQRQLRNRLLTLVVPLLIVAWRVWG
jgi:hypothetical protein